jgi:hypothetical protein
MLSLETDSQTAQFILNLIREEEAKTEILKQQASAVAASQKIAALTSDRSETAEEQAFNREQVQEQEQVLVQLVPCRL